MYTNSEYQNSLSKENDVKDEIDRIISHYREHAERNFNKLFSNYSIVENSVISHFEYENDFDCWALTGVLLINVTGLDFSELSGLFDLDEEQAWLSDYSFNQDSINRYLSLSFVFYTDLQQNEDNLYEETLEG